MRLIGLAVILTLNLMLPPAGEAGAGPRGPRRRGGLRRAFRFAGSSLAEPHLGAAATLRATRTCAQFLRRGLSELGYIEGQTLVVEVRWAEGRSYVFPSLAAGLVQLNPDLRNAASTCREVRIPSEFAQFDNAGETAA
jgi:hypothetical protein